MCPEYREDGSQLVLLQRLKVVSNQNQSRGCNISGRCAAEQEVVGGYVGVDLRLVLELEQPVAQRRDVRILLLDDALLQLDVLLLFVVVHYRPLVALAQLDYLFVLNLDQRNVLLALPLAGDKRALQVLHLRFQGLAASERLLQGPLVLRCGAL